MLGGRRFVVAPITARRRHPHPARVGVPPAGLGSGLSLKREAGNMCAGAVVLARGGRNEVPRYGRFAQT